MADNDVVQIDGGYVRDLQWPKCYRCKHFLGGEPLPACRAFPEEIPDDILALGFDHTQPYPGDRGIRFEPRDEEPRTA